MDARAYSTARKLIFFIAMAIIGLIPINGLAAIQLTFQPDASSVVVGNLRTVALVISGMNSVKLGAFSFDVNYPPAEVSAISVSYGSDLGAIYSLTDLATSGQAYLSAVSSESTGYLSSHQPSSFTLASVQFRGEAAGLSLLTFANVSLADADGNSLDVFTSRTGSVTVVPEPSTYLAGICALGILGLFGRRNRK